MLTGEVIHLGLGLHPVIFRNLLIDFTQHVGITHDLTNLSF